MQTSLPSENHNSEILVKIAIPVLIVFLLVGLIPLLAFSVSRAYSEHNLSRPETRTTVPDTAE